jgi:predicted anti-sigma-YlaC factor YlaD
MRTSGQTCDRAREWASLRMDDELSELESALLEAHLKRCPACASFAVEVEAVALELRAASLERLEQPISLPSRRTASPLRAVQLGAAAALVAAAAGLGTLFGALGSQPQQATLSLKLPANAALLAFDSSARGLPTTRQIALQQKPPRPIPRNLALPDV